MTRDEILNMPAGREMDDLIARKVFGWQKLEFPAVPSYQKPGKNKITLALYELPRYSTDIAAAWEVVEEMQRRNFWALINLYSSYCRVIFTLASAFLEPFEVRAEPNEIPLSICRAALLAVMK